MSADSHSQDPVVTTVLQDPAEDKAHHEQPHDQATEVAHAWEHFWENARFFAVFFAVVFLTMAASWFDFGPTGNKIAIGFFAVARCALIAYFMLSLFKTFSLVRNTFIFCAIFLIGMIFLSWWDSSIPGIGNPIVNNNTPSQKP